MNKRVKKILGILGSVALGAGTILTVSEGLASASGSFRPGNIISDQNMYVSTPTMSIAEIQKFLNTQGKRCTPREGRTCIKDYAETTISKAADQYCKNRYQGGYRQSAAEIIYRAAKACGISPQVLIVTLQKEQGLITSPGSPTAYRTAMGYACPDGAPCAAGYAGLQNQLYYAARQFQRYRIRPDEYSYRAKQNTNLLYNYNRSCGSSNVYIENAATAGLYNYTPYQPNQALINGNRDNCSSDGNWNFYVLYKAWFGDPQSTPKVAKKPVSVKTTSGNTGTQANTKKQAKAELKGKDRSSNPAPSATTSKEATKPKLVEKDPVKSKEAALKTDSDGKYLAKPGSEVTIQGENFPAEKPVELTLNGKKLDAIKADKAGKLLAKITLAEKGEGALVKITPPGAEPLEVKFKFEDDSMKIKVRRAADETPATQPAEKAQAPSLVIVKDKKSSAKITPGQQLKLGQELQMEVADLTPETTPEVRIIGLGNVSVYNLALNLAKKADANGKLTIDLTVPKATGSYKVVVKDTKTKLESTLFTLSVQDPSAVKAKPESRPQAHVQQGKRENPEDNELATTGTVGGISGVLALLLFIGAWQIRRYVKDNQPIRVNC